MKQTIDLTVPKTFAHASVADAMHHGVVACPPETSLRVVARMMAHQSIHCVVVFGDPSNYNDEQPWRIISDIDLLAAADSDFHELTAADAARTPLVVVRPAQPLADAARIMAENVSSHAIVVDPESRHPVGVLSTLDIATVLAFGRA